MQTGRIRVERFPHSPSHLRNSVLVFPPLIVAYNPVQEKPTSALLIAISSDIFLNRNHSMMLNSSGAPARDIVNLSIDNATDNLKGCQDACILRKQLWAFLHTSTSSSVILLDEITTSGHTSRERSKSLPLRFVLERILVHEDERLIESLSLVTQLAQASRSIERQREGDRTASRNQAVSLRDRTLKSHSVDDAVLTGHCGHCGPWVPLEIREIML